MPEVPATAYDVAIVGAGPTGLTLAILLGQKGHQVLVLERHAEHYPLPRAVVFDSEAARGLAGCGIADRFGEICEIGDDYTWLDADGELLLRIPIRRVGESGWPDANMMTQPELERVLLERTAELPTITLLRGVTASKLETSVDGVHLTADTSREQRSWVAAYVVGADGASSFVRQHMDTTVQELGFFYDWLIVDLFLDDKSPWVPMNRQICDPVRPTTMVSGGPGRRRWEFMRMPDDGEGFNSDETAWRLLKKWGVTPENATIERRALYTFGARWADRWVDGRLAIAGDAAHLMPPFAGMGMCSGIRDAVNLAWKLDLCLREVAAEALLDSYSTERSEHVRNAILLSVELGKVICETDHDIVAGRNAHLKSAGADPSKALPPVPSPTLGPGALQHEMDGQPITPAGQLAPQPLLRATAGPEFLADTVFGQGLTLFIDADIAFAQTLGERQLGLLEKLGLKVVALTSGPAAPEVYAEAQPGLLATMRAASYEVCVIRPDFYFYGGTRLKHIDRFLVNLAADLHLDPETELIGSMS